MYGFAERVPMRCLETRVLLSFCSLFFLVGICDRAAVAEVIISEIMYHPYHAPSEAEDTRQEWIELLNTGAESANLAGWRFSEGVEYAFAETVLEPGQYLVVAADVGIFLQEHPGITNVLGTWQGHLRNSGEKIEIRDASNAIVDSVHYADEGEWAVRELGPVDYEHRGWIWRDDHDGGGKPLELVNPNLPNEYGSNWLASLPEGGTPGRANSVLAESTAPLIVDVEHAPVIPSPADPVIVRARVIGDGADYPVVRLRFRADHSVYTNRDVYPTYDASDFTAIDMFDDGAHGDDAAGDGVYGGQVPPQEDGAVIEFFIEVDSDTGAARTWPAPSLVDGRAEQVTNALYRVDTDFNPYDYWTVGAEPLRYIIMTEAERGRLARIGQDSTESYSRARMNGTLISIDGDAIRLRYNVGVRNRGKGSRRPPPNNYRIDFPNDRPWKGVTAININSKYTYLQFLGNALFRMAGLPALNATRIQVRVNGRNLAPDDPSRMYGSYVQLEVYDSDWAEEHLPNDPQGNLYRCLSSGWHSDLQYLGEDPSAYTQDDYYAKASNAAENDWSDLIHLTWVLNEVPDDEYVERVGEVVNVDQWLRWIAMQTLLTNKETNLSNGRGDDYYMYRGVEDPRFILLPYDLDNILNWPDPNTSIWLDGNLDRLPAVRRLLTHPEFVPRYYRHLRDLCETVLAPARFDPLIEQLVGDWLPPQRVQVMKDFMRARTRYVLSVIPQGLDTQSELSMGDSYFFTVRPYLTGSQLFGTADPVTTRSVLINGQSAAW